MTQGVGDECRCSRPDFNRSTLSEGFNLPFQSLAYCYSQPQLHIHPSFHILAPYRFAYKLPYRGAIQTQLIVLVCRFSCSIVRLISTPCHRLPFKYIFYLFIYFGGKGGECFTHHNAEAPCVGLSPGLASGPKARLDGMPRGIPHPTFSCKAPA